jgi:hypothetical protein
MPTTRHLAAGGATQAANIIKETMKRLLGLAELGANAVGVQPFKQLRLRVVILRDESGQPLCRPQDLRASWAEAARIFSVQAHIRVISAAPDVLVTPHPAPKSALDVHCDDGAWQEDMDAAGDYFRGNCARTTSGRWLGYMAPVTVFIVRDISNKGGCSLGPLTDYVTLEAGMLVRARHRLLAHEVAHACGLWHSEDKENLMFPRGPGDRLTHWQALLLRNSRHVTLI